MSKAATFKTLREGQVLELVGLANVFHLFHGNEILSFVPDNRKRKRINSLS
jgi:hypothetical protein